MLVHGHHLRLLDEAWEPGCQQHLRTENQDSQHKLHQPTGPFPIGASNVPPKSRIFWHCEQHLCEGVNNLVA